MSKAILARVYEKGQCGTRLRCFNFIAPALDMKVLFTKRYIVSRKKVNGRSNLHDAVLCKDNKEKCIEFVRTVFGFRQLLSGTVGSQRLVVLRLLSEVPIEDGSHKFISVYGQRRFKYCISPSNFVRNIYVQAVSLLRPALLVVSPYWMRQTYGPLKSFDVVLEDIET